MSVTKVTTTRKQLCGWLCFHPKCMQSLAKPVPFLLALCGMTLVQSMACNGYLSAINTTIEKRYGLSTFEVGFIYASYEAACICATIFISYLAPHVNRARVLGLGCLIMGTGYLVFTGPRFWSGLYQPTTLSEETTDYSSTMCRANASSSTAASACSTAQYITTFNTALLSFCLAEFLMGLGASPLYVIGPTYLWDNLWQHRQRLYPTYSAWMYVTAAVGPAVGFLLGAVFLSIWVDTLSSEPPPGITEDSEKWLGAWWFGMLIFAIMQIVAALPLLAFPKGLPEPPRSQETSYETANGRQVVSTIDLQESDKKPPPPPAPAPADTTASEADAGPKSELPKMKQLPQAFVRLFTNPVWLFTTMLTVTEHSVVTGFITYISKYLQVAFKQPANKAGFITGGVVIPAVVCGILSGAYLIRCLSLKPLRGICRMLVILSLLTTGLMVLLSFINCAEKPSILDGQIGMESTLRCSSTCNCTRSMYQPVCLSEVSYMSPCHAGCLATNNHNFTSCGCAEDAGAVATLGHCKTPCQALIPFLVVLFFQVMLTSVGQGPSHILTLNSVPREDTSFALGMQVFLQRALAFIPAPIYFGKLFDITCLQRERSEDCVGGAGACLEYDLSLLPYMWLGVATGIKVIGIMLSLLTMWTAGRRTTADFHDDTGQEPSSGATAIVSLSITAVNEASYN